MYTVLEMAKFNHKIYRFTSWSDKLNSELEKSKNLRKNDTNLVTLSWSMLSPSRVITVLRSVRVSITPFFSIFCCSANTASQNDKDDDNHVIADDTRHFRQCSDAVQQEERLLMLEMKYYRKTLHVQNSNSHTELTNAVLHNVLHSYNGPNDIVQYTLKLSLGYELNGLEYILIKQQWFSLWTFH